MKTSLSAVLILILLSGTDVLAIEPGSRERTFVRSLELFESAQTNDDYRASARELESLLEDGYRNGAVYYNLGNACFRAGEFGRAILNYRKAKPYRPRDPYLSANLQQALAAAPGRLPESPRPWWTHVLFWTDWISFPAKAAVTCIGLSLAAMMLATGVFFRVPRLHAISTGLLVFSIAFGIDVTLTSDDVTDSHRAVITGETVARKGTGLSYEPAFDQPLKDGAEFQILSETPDWIFGHFEGIGDGWIRKEFACK